MISKETLNEIDQVFADFNKWLELDQTWETDLDGLSGIELVQAAGGKLKELIAERSKSQ